MFGLGLVPRVRPKLYVIIIAMAWASVGPSTAKHALQKIKLRNFERRLQLRKDLGFDARDGEWLVRVEPFDRFYRGNNFLNVIALVDDLGQLLWEHTLPSRSGSRWACRRVSIS